MVATIPYNPNVTVVGQGLFDDPSSVGGVQGTAMPDPATRYALRGGILAQSETIPMWGGCAIYENVPGATGTPGAVLGPVVGRATALTGSKAIAGFSVFDQAYGMINSPQSPVPLAASGMQVMSYRLLSGARIWVQASPNLVNLRGGPIGAAVSWDFSNQQLEPYVSTTISSGTYATATTISSGTYVAQTGVVTLTTNAAHGLTVGTSFTLSGMTGTNASTYLNGTFTAITGTTGSTLVLAIGTGLTLTITGGNLGTVGVTLTTAAAHGLLPGDTFEISSATGTGSFASINGEWTAVAGTTGSTLNFAMASGLTMTITGGTISSGGQLTVSVLDVAVGNSMTVNYASSTGFASWNYSGNTVLIQI